MAEAKEANSKGFTKTDMERVALFQEMGYVTIGDKYAVADTQFNASAGKGKQILAGGHKEKSALQSGYFSDKFTRVLEGEAYSDQVKMRRQHRLTEGKKNLGKQFVPTSGEKKASGLGSYYGTLSGPVPALSPQVRPGTEYKAPGKNFYTNPGKKGTGYGYVPVTFSHYHEYQSDNYDQYRELAKRENEAHVRAMKGSAFRLNMAPRAFFDENPYKGERPAGTPVKTRPTTGPSDMKPFKPTSPSKKDGGMKAGTFDPYPSHSADQYRLPRTAGRDKEATGGGGLRVFIPPPGPKSAPVNSVLHQNVTRSVNVQNYKTVQSVMAY